LINSLGNVGADSLHKKGLTVCFPKYFVDGQRWGEALSNEERMLLATAKRIEVYKAQEAPAEYLDNDGCGVILIWTR
jgi:hypothetical protein